MMYLLILIAVLTAMCVVSVMFKNLVPIIPGILAIVFLTLWASFNQIPSGYVGVVYQFGAIVDQIGEGLQWTAPWRTVDKATVQVQKHNFPKLDSFSAESQDVYVTATLNIQVSPRHIQTLYREVGPNYFDVLVAPRVFQAFKDETVKFKSTEIAPRREEIRKAVRERLTHELDNRSIVVEDLLIDNISFSKEFQASIERKQVASQDALAEEQKVESSKHIAQQAIAKAEGEGESILAVARKQAEANAMLSRSITQELIQYQMMQKLSPNISVMMIPAGQQFIMEMPKAAK